MHPQPVLYRWMHMITMHFPHLTYWQVVALAMFSYGVVLARHCQLSRVAEELAFIGQVDTVARRWRRLLSNPRLDVNACTRAWVRGVWDSYAGARPVLLVDETKLADRLGVLLVSLAYRGRAIPLVWRGFRANYRAAYPAEGQVGLITALLGLVQSALPADPALVVEADQGIGHSSALLRVLAGMGIRYWLRVAATSTFTTRCGARHHLYDLIQPGQQWSWHPVQQAGLPSRGHRPPEMGVGV